MNYSKSHNYYTGYHTRKTDALGINVTKSPSLAVYCAGVGVECLLRAFIFKHITEWDKRHSLKDLYETAVAYNIQLRDRKEELSRLISKLDKFWINSIRYMSNEEYRCFLVKQFQKTSKVKQKSMVKKMATECLLICTEIYKIGDSKWIP